jgi:UDP-N-acetylglucosamine 2-epimerase (non-hydrolysing)
MPEEINRIVTDAVSDILFTPSRDADDNLLHEGVCKERIFFVGNVMIDSLLRLLPQTENRKVLERFGLEPRQYAVLTLHRPTNVDDAGVLRGILDVLVEISQTLPIVWPVHPRARRSLEAMGSIDRLRECPTLKLTEPLGYLDMLALNQKSRLILTDSGGLQEEATILRVPCITLRDNTERPVTIECGCNRLAGNEPRRIRSEICSVLDGSDPEIGTPELWDGRAAERILEILRDNERIH